MSAPHTNYTTNPELPLEQTLWPGSSRRGHHARGNSGVCTPRRGGSPAWLLLAPGLLPMHPSLGLTEPAVGQGRQRSPQCLCSLPAGGAREAWRGNRASQRGQESPSRQPPHIPHQGQFTLHAPRAEVQGPDTVAPLFNPTFDTGRAGELSTDPLAQKKDTQQWTLLSCVVPVRLPADRCGESG